MGGLAQFVEQVRTVQSIECNTDAFTRLGHFYALDCCILNGAYEIKGRTRCHLESLGHQITAKHLKHSTQLITAKQSTIWLFATQRIIDGIQFCLGFHDAALHLIKTDRECLSKRCLLLLVCQMFVFYRQIGKSLGHLIDSAPCRVAGGFHLAEFLHELLHTIVQMFKGATCLATALCIALYAFCCPLYFIVVLLGVNFKSEN